MGIQDERPELRKALHDVGGQAGDQAEVQENELVIVRQQHVPCAQSCEAFGGAAWTLRFRGSPFSWQSLGGNQQT